MPSTHCGVIYSAGSKLIRRVVIPDNNAELDDPLHVMPGEAMLRVAHSDIAAAEASGQHAHHYLQGAILTATNTPGPAPSGRTALVHPTTQLVEGFVQADPSIDTHPTHTLVASDTANLNWKWDGKKFLARYVVVPKPGAAS
jgi:hypothetical protein